MELRILGCSGGIGGDRCTISMLPGHHVLIDNGSGVENLGLDEISRIVHVTWIPFLVDTVGGMRNQPKCPCKY